MTTWLAMVLAGAVAAALGALMPRLLAVLPEPAPPEPGDERVPSGPAKAPDAPPKPLYADLAARPGISVKLAVASGVAAVVLAAGTGADWRLLALVPLAAVGALLAYVDWTTQLLPTRIIVPSVVLTGVLVVVAALLADDRDLALRAAYGGAGGFALFFVLWFVYPRGMGYGDVRLAGLLGMGLAHVGWAELVVGIYGAFLVGGLGGLLLSLLKLVSRKRMPFGPFMLVAAVLAVPLARPIVGALLGV